MLSSAPELRVAAIRLFRSGHLRVDCCAFLARSSLSSGSDDRQGLHRYAHDEEGRPPGARPHSLPTSFSPIAGFRLSPATIMHAQPRETSPSSAALLIADVHVQTPNPKRETNKTLGHQSKPPGSMASKLATHVPHALLLLAAGLILPCTAQVSDDWTGPLGSLTPATCVSPRRPQTRYDRSVRGACPQRSAVS